MLLLSYDLDIGDAQQDNIANRVPLEPVIFGDCSAASTTVDVTVNGSPLNLPLHDSTNVFSHMSLFDPCSLGAGASDLPGTRLNVTAKTQGQYGGLTHSGTITLDKDTLAPGIEVHSTPKKGKKVKEGDSIEIRVRGKEQRDGGPWQTGIQTIKVNAGYALVGTPWTNPSPQPLPCDQKTWEQEYTATYKVPPNPPSSIHICAMVQDYAGNTNMKCADFPTDTPQPALWVGTVHGTMTTDTNGAYVRRYTDTYKLRLRDTRLAPTTKSDPKAPGNYRIVAYSSVFESEGSTVTSTYEGEWAGYEGATYRRFTCSDKSSTKFSDRPPNEQSGYMVYKTVSEPVTEAPETSQRRESTRFACGRVVIGWHVIKTISRQRTAWPNRRFR